MNHLGIFKGYTPVVDMCTLFLCLAVHFLMKSTYSIKRRNYKFIIHALGCLSLACILRIGFHELYYCHKTANLLLVLVMRTGSYVLLTSNLLVFTLYLCRLVGQDELVERNFVKCLWLLQLVFSIFQILEPILQYKDERVWLNSVYEIDGIVSFQITYIIFAIVICGILIIHRRCFFRKMYRMMWIVILFCVFIMGYQSLVKSTIFTAFIFFIPVISVVFMFYHNSYDYVTGTFDGKSFYSFLKDKKETEDLINMVFVHLENISMQELESLAEKFMRGSERYLKNSVSFRLRDDKICIVHNGSDLDERKKNTKIKEIMDYVYKHYKVDYKVVLINNLGGELLPDDYLSFESYVEEKLSANTVYVCGVKDVEEFRIRTYILNELHDISIGKDLNDSRVLLYAQPVYHIESGTYNTAEALMRLELPEIGIVSPEKCIPLAEKYEYVHVINLIILNKACQYLREIRKKGNYLERISVNFSISELLEKDFMEDVTSIIENNKIPYNKIAIELTETQKESDFDSIEKVMRGLQGLGIKFYLDDFGTSYSNFERIMELPIDIIKFDRSMTLLSGKDDNSLLIVRTMASLFNKTDFKILYEGVESVKDERRCVDMSAQYLQGFKYSKPLPIFELADFMKNNTVFS